MLIDNYQHYYENLLIKETLILANKKNDYTFDEGEYLVDTLVQFRESLDMLLKYFVVKQAELVHDIGGLNDKLYEV